MVNPVPNLRTQIPKSHVVIGEPVLEVRLPQCCALCPGVIDWHNCGIVLGVWEFGWDWFLYSYLLCVQYRGHWGPLYHCCVMGPRPSNVARSICMIL